MTGPKQTLTSATGLLGWVWACPKDLPETPLGGTESAWVCRMSHEGLQVPKEKMTGPKVAKKREIWLSPLKMALFGAT